MNMYTCVIVLCNHTTPSQVHHKYHPYCIVITKSIQKIVTIAANIIIKVPLMLLLSLVVLIFVLFCVARVPIKPLSQHSSSTSVYALRKDSCSSNAQIGKCPTIVLIIIKIRTLYRCDDDCLPQFHCIPRVRHSLCVQLRC